MAELSKLINSFCPDGVPYLSIGEVIFRYSEKAKNAPDITEVYSVSNTKGLIKSSEYWGGKVHSENTSNYNVVRPNMFAYRPAGIDVGTIGLMPQGQSGLVSPAYVVFGVKDCILSDYLMINLKSNRVVFQINQLKEAGARVKFDFNRWDRIKIPVPPIEIQNEIIRILKVFSTMKETLHKERELRDKQYNYYLEKLILSCEDAKKIKLSEVCSVYDGTHQTPKYTERGVKFVSVENIDDLYGTRKFISEEDFEKFKIKPQPGDILMTRITAGIIGKCTVIEKEEPLAYYVSLALLRPNQQKLDSKYLKYYIESNYGKKELKKYILTDATPPKINKDAIGKVSILVPSLEEQKDIVKIIQSFDLLCNSIGVGIPAEIAYREAQYTYYREKLLDMNQLK